MRGPRRVELLRWFQRTAPDIARAYEGAIHLLDMDDFPGRLRFVAHGFRDMTNQLPDCLARFKRTRLEYREEVEKVAKVWPDLAQYGKSAYEDTPEEGNSIPLSREGVLAVDELVQKHKNVPKTQEERIIQALMTRSVTDGSQRSSLRPLARRLVKLGQWFHGVAHFAANRDSSATQDEMLLHVSQFEAIALSIGRPFFTNKDEIDGILQQANSRES